MTNICAVEFNVKQDTRRARKSERSDERIQSIKEDILKIKNRFNVQDFEIQNKLDQVDDKLMTVNKVNLKVDQLETSVNDSFNKLETWWAIIGSYLDHMLTRRRWRDVPNEMKKAPSLQIE